MNKQIILSAFTLIIFLSSCAVQKEQLGNYSTSEGKTTVYEKGKDMCLFWNQVQIQDVEKNLKIKNYEKITKRTFFDNLIFYGTFGVVSYYSVKIKIKESVKNPETTTNKNKK
jgi:hypothetical protein